MSVGFGGGNTNSTGVVKSSSDANVSTVEDQAGKQRRSITNALGQLIRVDEPDLSGDLGTVSSPTQPTHYSYNTLGKMVHVNQGVQNRYFMHDSLGRLLRVRQPEQTVNTALNTSGNPDNNAWTIGFTYDNNGNLLTSRDANNVVITSTYDALNRVTQRSYNDNPQTPTVTYTYDDTANVPFSKGRLTKVYSTISEMRYTEYDEMGRLEKSEQRTDGEVYPSEYKYNLAGALIEQTYPSGRVVKNVLDANGDISMIQSKRNENFGFHNYAKHFSYNAAGAVTSMQLGNGLWETAQFNSRLQSTQLGLGALPTGANLWKVDYEFGELQTNGTVDAVKNSGNIARQTLTVPGTSFVQSYTYDSLYRLTEAIEKTGTTTNWSQQFGYDRYGNRTSLAQDIGGITKNTTPAVDVNKNRFTSTDFGYDANGNIVEDIDEMTSLPREFIFNGDNKQTEVKRDGVTIGRYYYDGEGRRVKKVTDTETTVFVYAGGQLAAEYSTAISQTPSVSYTTADHLGSPRVITNELGQVSSRRDFMPFGEELYAGIGNRTGDTGLKYSSSQDDIRQKFTGYQKDNETNLDFAEARMYANNVGRFTAVDPLLASGKSADPQTFNRYVYVNNSPLNRIDPSGLEFEFTGKDTKRFVKDVNNRKGKEFKVKLNKSGVMEVVNRDKVDVAKLSDNERTFFNAITDSGTRAKIEGIEKDAGIDFGGFKGNGTNQLDVSDMALLRKAEKSLAGHVVGHEMMEAYSAAKSGGDYDESHAEASKTFGEAIPTSADNLPGEENSETLSGGTVDYSITQGGRTTSFRVTTIFEKKEKAGSFSQLPRGHITKVEVIKNQ